MFESAELARSKWFPINVSVRRFCRADIVLAQKMNQSLLAGIRVRVVRKGGEPSNSREKRNIYFDRMREQRLCHHFP